MALQSKKTYLQLVNEVLKRLRETQVGSLNESTYSALIANFVNDAKEEVEGLDWNVLIQRLTFIVPQDTTEFNISETGNLISGDPFNLRSGLVRDPYSEDRVMVFDITDTQHMFQMFVRSDIERIRYQNLGQGIQDQEEQTYFSLQFDSENNRITFNLLDNPISNRTFALYAYVPQEELVLEGDVLRIPYWRPVVLLATLYALNERGEELGEPGNLAERRYLQALTDATISDAAIGFRFREPHTNFTID